MFRGERKKVSVNHLVSLPLLLTLSPDKVSLLDRQTGESKCLTSFFQAPFHVTRVRGQFVLRVTDRLDGGVIYLRITTRVGGRMYLLKSGVRNGLWSAISQSAEIKFIA